MLDALATKNDKLQELIHRKMNVGVVITRHSRWQVRFLIADESNVAPKLTEASNHNYNVHRYC